MWYVVYLAVVSGVPQQPFTKEAHSWFATQRKCMAEGQRSAIALQNKLAPEYARRGAPFKIIFKCMKDDTVEGEGECDGC